MPAGMASCRGLGKPLNWMTGWASLNPVTMLNLIVPGLLRSAEIIPHAAVQPALHRIQPGADSERGECARPPLRDADDLP